MILVLTSPDDTHADRVCDLLDQADAPWFRFDPAAFPHSAQLTVTTGATGLVQRLLVTRDHSLDLAQVTALWYRRPQAPVVEVPGIDPSHNAALAEECQHLVRDLWETLACLMVPASYWVIQRAQHKISQLQLATALGFELPPTMVTNDPSALIAFSRAHNGQIISKPCMGLALQRTGYYQYTRPVTRRDLAAAETIHASPMIFQKLVPKAVEVRITVVGDQVFAVAIHSQVSHHTRYDWRRYHHDHTPLTPHTLPPALAAQCVALVARMGLTYGAIDMILTPNGRYIFLEINPNGQYLWVESRTGVPISAAIARLLQTGTHRTVANLVVSEGGIACLLE